MANEYTENLKKGKKTQFKSGENAAESGRKGGRKSQEVQKERKTVQRIVCDFIDGEVKGNKVFAKLAREFGIESDKSIKELITCLAVINTAHRANLDELIKLCAIIGEQAEEKSETSETQKKLLDAIEKAVKNAD